jgi:hypothetical protein
MTGRHAMKNNLRELTYVLAASLVSASLLTGSAAQAMEIEKFDKMDGRDQSEYIVVLIEGAQQVLIKEGKKELAAKIHALFTTTLPGDQSPVGVVEFERNLARARLADIRNLQKDPRAPRLEVEDAMVVTLEKNGIPLPDTFFTVASAFRPQYPPKR